MASLIYEAGEHLGRWARNGHAFYCATFCLPRARGRQIAATAGRPKVLTNRWVFFAFSLGRPVRLASRPAGSFVCAPDSRRVNVWLANSSDRVQVRRGRFRLARLSGGAFVRSAGQLAVRAVLAVLAVLAARAARAVLAARAVRAARAACLLTRRGKKRRHRRRSQLTSEGRSRQNSAPPPTTRGNNNNNNKWPKKSFGRPKSHDSWKIIMFTSLRFVLAEYFRPKIITFRTCGRSPLAGRANNEQTPRYLNGPILPGEPGALLVCHKPPLIVFGRPGGARRAVLTLAHKHQFVRRPAGVQVARPGAKNWPK